MDAPRRQKGRDGAARLDQSDQQVIGRHESVMVRAGDALGCDEGANGSRVHAIDGILESHRRDPGLRAATQAALVHTREFAAT